MYEFSSRVRYSEVSGDGKLSTVALINYLQDCGAFHSEDAGFGLKWLTAHGNGWFVTTYQIRIDSLPELGEEIRIATYPTSMKGMIGERYFTIRSADNSVTYARAKSIWVLMDLAAAKPARVHAGMAEAYVLGEPPTDEDWGPRKIHPAERLLECYDFVVSPTYLDSNSHMNNAYYIEAAKDALPCDYDIAEIRIEYRKPAKLGERVHVFYGEHQDAASVVLKNDDGETYSVSEFRSRQSC